MKMYFGMALSLAWAMAATPLNGQEAQQSPENLYDVLGKALRPLGNVFAMDDNGQPGEHGLVLDAHLIQMQSGASGAGGLNDGAEIKGTTSTISRGQAVHIALMTPDALLVQAPIAGETYTVCRDGDTLWAMPGSKIEALLRERVETAESPSKKQKKRKSDAAKLLGPLALPVREQEMAFLPILFQAADVGEADMGGVRCHVLDVQFMPQLSKSLNGWAARLWIGPDYGIRQLTLRGPHWSGTVVIDKLTFPAELPEATFQPAGGDVMRLTAAQFLDLIGRIGK